MAVEGLTITINDGEVFGFLGPNGAGKTTTIRMLCCLIEPTSGQAFVDGLDINDKESRIKIRQNIGLLPENPGLYESLSAYQNLDFYAKMYGVPADKRSPRITELLQALDILDRKNDAVGSFSKGMKQKIAIARALVHDPKYLFLDEPTSGLDPVSSITVRNYLMELKREGRTIFINTHHLDEAQKLCDRIGILKTRLLAKGSPEQLANEFFGKTTMVELGEVTAETLRLIQASKGVKAFRQDGNRVYLTIDDPVKDNPAIVSELVRSGASVIHVEEVRKGLEDVYLRIVGGEGK
ncbi:MAG TPA: ABC transporter ATP-binding protein [Methanomassiliicoccales archaeon]